MIKNCFRTFALGSVAAFALACMGTNSAHAQQSTTVVNVPTPSPSTIIGTDPVPPPPPSFAVTRRASL